MKTKHESIRSSRGLRRVGGALAAFLFAAAVHAQSQISTVIATGLLEPNSITSDPNNNIYLTDASDNRIVEFVPGTGQVLTLAGSGTIQGGYSNSIYGAQAQFSQPLGIVYDPFRAGLVVVDQVNQVLRLVTLAGAVSTLAGVPATLANGGLGGANDGAAATAQFSFPAGLATDGVGNLYVADAGNSAIRRVNSANGVNTVQVTKFVVAGAATNYSFYGPTAVALDANNNLWVADTRNDTICVISNISVINNQTAYIIAGAVRKTGTNDAAIATAALFNLPSGLLWDPNGAGLFISDTGNDTVRRLYPNLTQGGFSVGTVAGIPRAAGKTDGLTNVAELNSPIGLAVDAINNGYYIVDRGNNELRRYQTGPPLPAVASPQIGIITFPIGSTGAASLFTALPEGGIFNTNNIIAIYNTDSDPNVQTYYMVTNTPVSPLCQHAGCRPPIRISPPIIPGTDRPRTRRNTTTLPPLPLPYEVTMYAHQFRQGPRPQSMWSSANFTYITAPPVIGGNNGAIGAVDRSDQPFELYGTLWTAPRRWTNGAGNLRAAHPSHQHFLCGDQQRNSHGAGLLRPGFAPSAIVSQIFTTSNFLADQITFGFASGEASSQFLSEPPDNVFTCP
jgi:sugar lactone lactonase YvrE